MTDTRPNTMPPPADSGTDRGPGASHTVTQTFVEFLETGTAAPGLFAPEVFCDLSLPTWRLQASGREGAVALRRTGHPWAGRVSVTRVDPMPTGFVLEAQERWTDDDGRAWHCRELFRADVGPDGITELAVYCTGDWDEARTAQHAASVRLIRP